MTENNLNLNRTSTKSTKNKANFLRWQNIDQNVFFYKSFLDESGDANKTIVDLTKQGLKKVQKNEDNSDVRQLILDENEIQKIENIESYPKIEKVSYYKFFLHIFHSSAVSHFFNT